ncbi:MAG TPA: hypothetical protein VEZ41_01945 [Allosphingosinicella sp.]|jgi:hypothetical protein|nr:hypothetical protein [Allosphingosinicella sp.]
MSKRDRDSDLPEFLPDLATIRREMDLAYGEKKLREALDNPGLERAQSAIGDDPQKEAAKESPSPYEVPIQASVGVGVPQTSRLKMRPQGATARRPLPVWAVYILAVLAVLGPVAMVLALVRTPPRPEAGTAPLVVSGPESAGVRASEPAPPAAVGVKGSSNAGADPDAQVEAAPVVPEKASPPPRPIRSQPAKASGPGKPGRAPAMSAPAERPVSEPTPPSPPPPMAPDMAP